MKEADCLTCVSLEKMNNDEEEEKNCVYGMVGTEGRERGTGRRDG